MAKVLGLGGLFLKCKDVEATRAWYERVLKMTMDEYGGTSFLHKTAADSFPSGARTVFAPFKDDVDYFKPSELPFMFNLIVDDLDGILVHLANENVPLEGEVLDESYGRFAWIMDPDGRKVELWQPIEGAEL